MGDKSFVRKAFELFVLSGSAAITAYLVSHEIKKYRLRKILLQLKEDIAEYRVHSKVIEIIQALEDLEKEIKASEDEKLLELFVAVSEKINSLPQFELKE